MTMRIVADQLINQVILCISKKFNYSFKFSGLEPKEKSNCVLIKTAVHCWIQGAC